MKRLSPGALYRAEKERVTRERTSTHARLLAEAKAAFEKLIAEGQAARKGGRPKGSITLGSPKRVQPVEPVVVLAPPVVKVAAVNKASAPKATAKTAKATKPKSAAKAVRKKAVAKSRKPARTVKKKVSSSAKKKKPSSKK